MKDLTTKLENELRAAISTFVSATELAEEALKAQIHAAHSAFAEDAAKRTEWMDGQLADFIPPRSASPTLPTAEPSLEDLVAKAARERTGEPF